jgi:hypothetical protein
MNCKYLNVRRISRAMTSAIAMMLGITALAQDSAPLRMPRRAFDGRIDIRNANIADAATGADPNTAQGPGPGASGRGRLATCSLLRHRLARL